MPVLQGFSLRPVKTTKPKKKGGGEIPLCHVSNKDVSVSSHREFIVLNGIGQLPLREKYMGAE